MDSSTVKLSRERKKNKARNGVQEKDPSCSSRIPNTNFLTRLQLLTENLAFSDRFSAEGKSLSAFSQSGLSRN